MNNDRIVDWLNGQQLNKTSKMRWENNLMYATFYNVYLINPCNDQPIIHDKSITNAYKEYFP